MDRGTNSRPLRVHIRCVGGRQVSGQRVHGQSDGSTPPAGPVAVRYPLCRAVSIAQRDLLPPGPDPYPGAAQRCPVLPPAYGRSPPRSAGSPRPDGCRQQLPRVLQQRGALDDRVPAAIPKGGDHGLQLLFLAFGLPAGVPARSARSRRREVRSLFLAQLESIRLLSSLTRQKSAALGLEDQRA